MKKRKTMRITQDDYIKANRKASREAEIAAYGHPICHKRVHKSKKIYDRKRIKGVAMAACLFCLYNYGGCYFI